MNRKLFGVVIRVKNLEVCRAFYRDVLNLGTPVMDSNFWVEFKLNESSSLCLEKIEWDDPLPQKSWRSSWILMVDNIEEFVNRMAAYGYKPNTREEDSLGFSFQRFEDPEGNAFMVSTIEQHITE